MSELSEKVKSIIGDVFSISQPIEDELCPSDIEGWDSVGHVKLIVRLESELNINFDLDELIEMINVGSIISVIERKFAGF